jgi:putative transposase
LALRHQILTLQRQAAGLAFTERDRVVLGVLCQLLDRARLGEVLLIVRPETVLRWHRGLVARHWTHAMLGRPSGRRWRRNRRCSW